MTVISTSCGPVPIWGRRLRSSSSSLFVIRGAMPPPMHLTSLVEAFPSSDVILVHLPGMHSPYFADCGMTVFSAAFDEVIAEVLGDRDVHVLGVSMGGVAAFGLRSPQVRSTLALDTPLTTAGLWPLHRRFSELATRTEEAARWFDRIFGVRPDRVENRDYSPTIQRLATPTTMLLAEDPLEPRRQLTRMPSLVSERDREAYAASDVEVRLVEGSGHDIPATAADAFMNELRCRLDR